MTADSRSGYACRGGLEEFGHLVARATEIRLSNHKRASGEVMVSLHLWDRIQNPGFPPSLWQGAGWDLGWKP